MMHRGIDAFFVVATLVSGAFATDVHGASHVAASASVNVCNSGVTQSPIDLHTCPVKIKAGGNDGETINIPMERPELAMSYGADGAVLTKVCEHDGCTLHITPMSDVVVMNMMTVPGEVPLQYTLDRCVLRMPSEHTINHNTYPLEIQCHHTMEHTGHKRKGIVSTLYEVGVDKDNAETYSAFVASILGSMPIGAAKPSVVKNFAFTPTGTAGTTRYHTYKGSQTTGDCKEDVDWYVMFDPAGISQAQVNYLKKNMSHHAYGWKAARPIQDLYGRHPEGCHHAHEGAAAPAALGALCLSLALFSVFGRA